MRRTQLYGRLVRRPRLRKTEPEEKPPNESIEDFGIGSIRLDLSKTTFSAGEAIEGRLLLTMEKTIRAKGLFAILSAEKLFQKPAGDLDTGRVQTFSKKIYHYQQQLDTEREYRKDEGTVAYPFRLVLPPVLGSAQTETGTGHELQAGTESALTGSGPEADGNEVWSVEGYLDLPLAYNVKAKKRIWFRQDSYTSGNM